MRNQSAWIWISSGIVDAWGTNYMNCLSAVAIQKVAISRKYCNFIITIICEWKNLKRYLRVPFLPKTQNGVDTK
jgi:hypothetical protein